jgi:hypothetical protein
MAAAACCAITVIASAVPAAAVGGPSADKPVIKEYQVPGSGGFGGVYGITTGPDGALWFTQVLPKIAADNPGLILPAIRITPVVRTDGSGVTAQFTRWMAATEGSYWTAYCAVVGRSPCTPTSAYPVQPGTSMVGQAGELGVAGYVSQPQAEGAIGYIGFFYALETGFPVVPLSSSPAC